MSIRESKGRHSSARLSFVHNDREAVIHSGRVKNDRSLNTIALQTSKILACWNILAPAGELQIDGPTAARPLAVPCIMCCSQPTSLVSDMSWGTC